MREAHPLERAVGIDHYVSDADGIGGRLRDTPEDFRVREVEDFDYAPVDADPGNYSRLVLRVTLRGWDTNDFASRLSDKLGVSRERVAWAGTKDKHAVTTQLFTVNGVDADAVPEIDHADIEAVGRAGRDLGFGDLAGNEFGITVRDPDRPENVAPVTADLAAFGGMTEDEAVAAAEAALDGDEPVPVALPNYFGQQRFGSIRPVTHEVGLHVVRGDWRGAVLAYVGNPHEDEPDDTREARAFVEEQAASDDPDWAEALDRVPGRLRYERSMLHRLDVASGTDEDWRDALEAVPSNLQRLFVNAAQSYAYNRILSARLERGLPFDRPVAGDVVCFADRDAPDGMPLPDPGREQRVDSGRVDVVTRHCERGRAFVTAPLVGRDTELADGEPGEIEREVLDDLGLSQSDFDLPGEFDSTGTRRAILLRTDLTVAGDENAPSFRFALPSGSYATVLMREYLKRGPLDL
ncbi:tRNA pseudouridine(13) synthase TruD [Halobium salinum]|uniref:Probable tRNA pseudouridine synthase D n=1 Tax=Halobium salinum TaxID=1364940 RepID=A0ABD5PDL5_9EURY|nr:tRNA pseudouridine(13) synthase TruD [Halobium salinum]